MAHHYSASCQFMRAKNDSGPRRAKSIRLVVIHSAESTSASGVATFFATTAQASTQLAVDDHGCYRMLPDLVIPWGAPGANSDGLHVEICGYAKWDLVQWRGHEPMLRRTAWKVAKWCWLYDIPARWLTDKQLMNGTAKGLTQHRQVSKVFKKSDHTDPGPNFPDELFIDYVVDYLTEIEGARAR
jgi:hypothetical protein